MYLQLQTMTSLFREVFLFPFGSHIARKIQLLHLQESYIYISFGEIFPSHVPMLGTPRSVIPVSQADH